MTALALQQGISNVIMQTTEKYDRVARFFHWLTVLLVSVQFILGWTMPDVRRDTQPVGLIGAHIVVGTALLAAMLCRLLWRLTHRPPRAEIPAPLRYAIPLPGLSPTGLPFGYEMGDVHSVFAWALFTVICLHIGGAMMHLFILRDRIAQRMTPW
jgi:cytochrome b561